MNAGGLKPPAGEIPLAPRAGMAEDTMYGEDSKPL